MQLWRQGRVRAVERVDCGVEADARVLDHLANLGCDPASPRECRHYLYVRGEPDALAAARSLDAVDGWDVECEQVQDAWLVTASIVTRLNDEIVRDTRVRFETLAHAHGGEYDGWEAAAD